MDNLVKLVPYDKSINLLDVINIHRKKNSIELI